MNNLFDMLTKAGYEVSSIGNDVLPCTLRLGEEPIGFLMDDLSLRLLPDQDKEHGRLKSILSFSTENQGIEQQHGEYVLSHYQDVLFTAVFDYDSCRPVYNIYSRDRDDNWTLLNSAEDRAAAAQDFATRSGLTSENIPEPARDIGRISKFMDAIQTKGFQLHESRKEAQRAFDITDQDGKEVGYIGKDNKVTITSEDNRVKHLLTDAYLESNSGTVLLPSFFERLKERLKEIGMALKVIFTPQGRHYAIRNESHQNIASVEEQTHDVTYTDLATEAEKNKIDALVDEIRRDEAEKGNEEKEHSEPEKEESTKTVPAISPENIRLYTTAILSDRSASEAFLDAVLQNLEFKTLLSQKLTETRQVPAPNKEKSTSAEKGYSAPAKEMAVPAAQNQETKNLKQEFDKDYCYLQTLFGFNQEKYDTLRADMISRFGTDDPKEFQNMLDTGKLETSGKLQGRLETSRKIADMKNATRQTEKPQEKERA